MSAPQTVLIVGATGLIAASLIPALRQGTFAHLKLTALIRPGSTKATQLRTLGVQTLAGSFEDATLLASLAGQYDIVLDMADSAKPDVTKALVEGMKARPKGQGVLIHLTGTGNFLDGKGIGEFDKSGKVWDVSAAGRQTAPGPD
jgi:nucleoside-diphosphate-sugar epimerase